MQVAASSSTSRHVFRYSSSSTGAGENRTLVIQNKNKSIIDPTEIDIKVMAEVVIFGYPLIVVNRNWLM